MEVIFCKLSFLHYQYPPPGLGTEEQQGSQCNHPRLLIQSGYKRYSFHSGEESDVNSLEKIKNIGQNEEKN